jgi:hypothetical protein
MHQPDIDGERRHHENHLKNQTDSLLVKPTLGIIDSAVNKKIINMGNMLKKNDARLRKTKISPNKKPHLLRSAGFLLANDMKLYDSI